MVTSKIIMEHGGQISFESEEGNGATFILKIPPANPADNSDQTNSRISGVVEETSRETE